MHDNMSLVIGLMGSLKVKEYYTLATTIYTGVNHLINNFDEADRELINKKLESINNAITLSEQRVYIDEIVDIIMKNKEKFTLNNVLDE